MRKPRPEAFDPKVTQRRMDAIDLSGVVPLQPQKPIPGTDNHQDTQRGEAGGTVIPRYRDTTTPSHHGTMPPRHSDTEAILTTDVFQIVRKAVKEFGKEAATHRFTQAEKQTIAELVYSYKARGIRTSENEIARIAINYLVHDYHVNGERSILHQCLVSLNE